MLKTHKIILAGLDSVGKTSIYKKMIEGADVEDVKDLTPTKGIERSSQIIMDNQVVFWELGGQAVYRSQYFQNKQTFEATSLLIYVIDVQDKERFDESLDYLLEILMIIKDLDSPPRIFVLMHKFDPDKIDDLRENFLEASKIFREVKNIPSLNITRFPTSIHSDNLDFAFKKIMERVVPKYTDPLMAIFEDDAEDFEENVEDTKEDEFQTKDDLKFELTKHFSNALNRIRVKTKARQEEENPEL